MKTFEGLKIPFVGKIEKHNNIEITQSIFCQNIIKNNNDGLFENCIDMNCIDCIYCTENISTFVKWYHIKNREEKLKRILQ